MTADIALTWSNELLRADISVARGDVVLDFALQTAVLISLLSDREAAPGDVLPDDDGPRSRTFWPSKLVQYQLPLCYNLLNIS